MRDIALNPDYSPFLADFSILRLGGCKDPVESGCLQQCLELGRLDCAMYLYRAGLKCICWFSIMSHGSSPTSFNDVTHLLRFKSFAEELKGLVGCNFKSSGDQSSFQTVSATVVHCRSTTG